MPAFGPVKTSPTPSWVLWTPSFWCPGVTTATLQRARPDRMTTPAWLGRLDMNGKASDVVSRSRIFKFRQHEV